MKRKCLCTAEERGKAEASETETKEQEKCGYGKSDGS